MKHNIINQLYFDKKVKIKNKTKSSLPAHIDLSFFLNSNCTNQISTWFSHCCTIQLKWEKGKFLGTHTFYTLPSSPRVHVVLTRELRIEKMLNKHPWAAAGQKWRQKNTQPREDTVRLVLQAEQAGNTPFFQLIYTKHVFGTGPHAWT